MTRVALLAFSVAFVAVHGVLAWQAPVQASEVEVPFTFAQLVGVLPPIVHVIALPLAGLAVVFGLFTVAARRLPRSDWQDTISIIALTACAWVATPSAALAWQQPTWIYGAAAALWVAAPYRCGWRPHALVIFAGALCAGSSERQIAVPLLVGVAYAVYRMEMPRPRWALSGLAGVALGTAAKFVEVHLLDLSAFVEGSGKLVVLTLSLQKGAHLFALLLGLALVALVRATKSAFEPGAETVRWIWAWCGLAVLAVFDPALAPPTLFPSALVLCIAAFPVVGWLVRGSPRLVGAVAVATQIAFWIGAGSR